MVFILTFAVFSLLAVTINSVQVLGPVIQTALGPVQGFYAKSSAQRSYLAFEGIPYAKPPLEKLRFMEPQKMNPWKDVLIANTSYACLQLDTVQLSGEEDCLYLNVYVPKVNITGTENLDVIAFIRSRDFQTINSRELGDYQGILDRNLIFVNFSYRLGIFGFFTLGDEVVPGNNGLKDQVMVLQWIRDNIKYFGGNPNSVTLTGVTSGGASVHYHYLSPLSRGLFHRGISHSGTALNPWALVEESLERSKIMATALNCNRNSSLAIIECLEDSSDIDIIKAVKILDFKYLLHPYYPKDTFGPVVERGKNAFLPDHPYKLIRDGKLQHLPWVTSNCCEESGNTVYILQTFEKVQEFSESFDQWIPRLLCFNHTANVADWSSIGNKIKEKYFRNESLSKNNLHHLSQLFADRLFIVDADTALRMHARSSRAPVYYYSFENVLYPMRHKISCGVHTFDDGRLLYNFNHNPYFSSRYIAMKDILLDFLYNFARTGQAKLNGIEWKPITPPQIDYMRIVEVNDIKMHTKQELAPRDFWNSIPIRENQKLFNSIT